MFCVFFKAYIFILCLEDTGLYMQIFPRAIEFSSLYAFSHLCLLFYLVKLLEALVVSLYSFLYLQFDFS